MKRSPIKRGTSQLRRTRIAHTDSKRTRRRALAAKSVKRNALDVKFYKFKRARLHVSPYCDICPILRNDGVPLESAIHNATELHHIQKLSQGGAYISIRNTIRTCRWANGWVEDNPDHARQLGLVRHASPAPQLLHDPRKNTQ
jgi:hypothetical protein